MAKYDHGGGCACGLHKTCVCGEDAFTLSPAKHDQVCPSMLEQDQAEPSVAERNIVETVEINGHTQVTDKSLEQKKAWLDGFKAATDTASSFRIHVDGSVDATLNFGARCVADLLKHQISIFEEEMKHG